MRIGYVSAIAGQPATTLDDIVAEVRGVESDGFAFYVVPSIFSLDAVGMLTVAGRETDRIELIPAVVPTPRSAHVCSRSPANSPTARRPG